MITIILLSIAGAVIAAIVGTLWYSNTTPMGRIHVRSLGHADKLSSKPMMPKLYAAQFILSFMMVFFTVFVITMSVRNGVPFRNALVFPIIGWICFVVPTVGSSIIWGNIDSKIVWPKFFSDIFSYLVTILLVAFLTYFFI